MLRSLDYVKGAILHGLFEVGASAETKYRAGSEILRLALRSSGNQRHRLLHWALDVVLHGGRFNELERGTDFHQQYWELGHQIASEMLKGQDRLNISGVWLKPNYQTAVLHLDHTRTPQKS